MFYTVDSVNGKKVICTGAFGVFVVSADDVEGEIRTNSVIVETGNGKYKVCGENMDNIFQIPTDMI